MRSDGGTKEAAPAVVTFSTNATMACFAAPSFQLGSGSTWTCSTCGGAGGMGPEQASIRQTATRVPAPTRLRMRIMTTPCQDRPDFDYLLKNSPKVS